MTIYHQIECQDYNARVYQGISGYMIGM